MPFPTVFSLRRDCRLYQFLKACTDGLWVYWQVFEPPPSGHGFTAYTLRTASASPFRVSASCSGTRRLIDNSHS